MRKAGTGHPGQIALVLLAWLVVLPARAAADDHRRSFMVKYGATVDVLNTNFLGIAPDGYSVKRRGWEIKGDEAYEISSLLDIRVSLGSGWLQNLSVYLSSSDSLFPADFNDKNQQEYSLDTIGLLVGMQTDLPVLYYEHRKTFGIAQAVTEWQAAFDGDRPLAPGEEFGLERVADRFILYWDWTFGDDLPEQSWIRAGLGAFRLEKSGTVTKVSRGTGPMGLDGYVTYINQRETEWGAIFPYLAARAIGPLDDIHHLAWYASGLIRVGGTGQTMDTEATFWLGMMTRLWGLECDLALGYGILDYDSSQSGLEVDELISFPAYDKVSLQLTIGYSR